jgi:DNA-binding PadR family transcriptional regulator
MVQKLIILGILKDEPSSGYDIKKFIGKKLEIFSELNTQSIYYPLKKMEREGLIKRKGLRGKKHLKYIYYITPKGEREFNNLCKEALISKKRPFIDIDIPLYFLPALEKKEVISRLRLRRRFLEKVKEWLLIKLRKEGGFLPHQILLLRHHLNLLSAEERFVEEFIGFLKQYDRE